MTLQKLPSVYDYYDFRAYLHDWAQARHQQDPTITKSCSRRIRILYSIPLATTSEGLQFDLTCIFAHRSSVSLLPQVVDLVFSKSPSINEEYVLRRSSGNRAIEDNTVYKTPRTDFSSPMTIAPLTKGPNRVYTSHLRAEAADSYYYALFCSRPDSIAMVYKQLLALARHHGAKRPGVDLQITIDGKKFQTPLTDTEWFSVYLKTNTPWDSTLTFFVYDSTGATALRYQQQVIPDTTNQSILALLWASQFSTKWNQDQPLGALHGFVDSKMSLLALESDSMGTQAQQPWEHSGVPPLLPWEIIPPLNQETVWVPDIYLHFDIPQDPLSVASPDKTALHPVHFTVSQSGVQLNLQFSAILNEALAAVLYDARGRVVHRWEIAGTHGSSVTLTLPRALRGTYVLRVSTGKLQYRQSVHLR